MLDHQVQAVHLDILPTTINVLPENHPDVFFLCSRNELIEASVNVLELAGKSVGQLRAFRF